MEVPRLGVKSELQLLAYTTTTVMCDLSPIFDLHHSSWQCQLYNPLSKARDQTHILMDTSQVCFCCATTGTPFSTFLEAKTFHLPSYFLQIVRDFFQCTKTKSNVCLNSFLPFSDKKERMLFILSKANPLIYSIDCSLSLISEP